MPPTKLQVNWPFSSGEEPKIDFQDDGQGVGGILDSGGPSWISNRNDFSYEKSYL